MNKDKPAAVSSHDREVFLNNLRQFYRARGWNNFDLNVRLGGHSVDLYVLYNAVTELGGSNKVSDQDKWPDILSHFRIPQACGNASYALKQVFQKYLAAYERVNRLDLDVEQTEEDDVGALGMSLSKRRSVQGSLGSLMSSYNSSPGFFRRQSMDTGTAVQLQPNRYQKIEKSLMSGLPNEVDFAVNVLTLLSSEGRHTLRLSECPNLVDILLAHAGIFSPERADLQDLYNYGWKKHANGNFMQFWKDSCIGQQLVTSCLISLDDFPAAVARGDEHEDLSLPSVDGRAGAGEDGTSLLLLGRNLGLQDIEGQRILQIAMILRNLSFDESNMEVLASKRTVFRFILLCIYSRWHNLKQLAYDTLSNIAIKVVLDAAHLPVAKIVLHLLSHGLESADRFDVVNALDMLARLCQVAASEDVLTLCLTPTLYTSIVHLLTVQDIQLVISVLEALYQLSELGEVACSHIASVHSSVGTLVSLLTVEAQSYGPSALINIKVVEHVPAPASGMPQQQPPPHIAQVAMPPPGPAAMPYLPPPQGLGPQPLSATPSLHPPAPEVRTPGPVRPSMAPQQQFVMPTVSGRPPLAVMPQQGVMTTGVGPVPVQVGPAADVESGLCSWLASQLMPIPGATLPALQLYREYAASFSHTGRIVDSSTFSRCLRATFPSVEVTQVTRPDGMQEVLCQGLQRRQPMFASRGMVMMMPQPTAPQTPQLGQAPVAPVYFPGPASERAISPQQYPAIQHALYGGAECPPSHVSGSETPSSQSGPASPLLSSGFNAAGVPFSAISPPPDGSMKVPGSSVIKSLLANKVSHRRLDSSSAATPGQPVLLSSPKADFQNAYQSFVTCAPSTAEDSSASDVVSTSAKKKKKKKKAAKPKEEADDGAMEGKNLRPSRSRAAAAKKGTEKEAVSIATAESGVAFEVCKGVELAQNIVQEEQGEHEARIEKVVNVQATSATKSAIDSSTHVGTNGVAYATDGRKGIVCNGSRGRFDSTNSIAEEVLDGMMNGDDDLMDDDYDDEDGEMEDMDEDDAAAQIKELPREQEQEILKKLKAGGMFSSMAPKVNGVSNHVYNGALTTHEKVGPTNCNSVDSKCLASSTHKATKDTVNGQQVHGNGLSADGHNCSGSHAANTPNFSNTPALPQMNGSVANGGLTSGDSTSSEVSMATDGNVDAADNTDADDVKPNVVDTSTAAEALASGDAEQISNEDGNSSQSSVSGLSCSSDALLAPAMAVSEAQLPSIGAVRGQMPAAAALMPGQAGQGMNMTSGMVPRAPGAVAATGSRAPAAVLRCFQQPNGQLAWGLFPTMPMPMNNGLNGASPMEQPAQQMAAGFPGMPPNMVQQGLMPVQQQGGLPPQAQVMPQPGMRVMLPPRTLRPPVVMGPPGVPFMMRGPPGYPMQGPPRPMVVGGLQSPGQVLVGQQQPLAADPAQSLPSPSAAVGAGSAKKRTLQGQSGDTEGSASPPVKKKKKKKSCRSESSDSRNSASPSSLPTSPPPGPGWTYPALRSSPFVTMPPLLVCEWRNCARSFPTIASLRLHVHNEHIDRKQASCVCQWDGCDGIQRQFWSFVTHLQDRHLCDQNLQAAAMRRQQAALTSSATPPAPPMPPVTIYPNDAAFQAIRRFFVPPPYPELMEGKPEGPVTKHIRLTAALILRNLAHYSPLGCSLVKRHEQQLAYVAMSAVESSNAISACLLELHSQ